MAGSRLELVFGGTPPDGRLLLIGAGRESDLSHFDADRTQIVQRLYPDVVWLRAQGFHVLRFWNSDDIQAVMETVFRSIAPKGDTK